MKNEKIRAEFEAWAKTHYYLSELGLDFEDDEYVDMEVQGAFEAYQAGRAALQSQDREDALIESVLEACDEWSRYVDFDHAPRTLREHIQLTIDRARRIEGKS